MVLVSSGCSVVVMWVGVVFVVVVVVLICIRVGMMVCWLLVRVSVKLGVLMV